MKPTLFFLAAFFAFNTTFPQYTVTKIIGQVKNKTSGERLIPGSKLKDDDLIEFSSSNDMLRVFVSGKGIYVLSPTPRGDNQQNMIVEKVKSAQRMKSGEGSLSEGSDDNDLIPAVLITESSVNKNNLITFENKYLFDSGQYDVSTGNSFFLQAEYPWTKPEIHQLKTIGDTLFIYFEDFKPQQSEVNGNGKYSLRFYRKDKNINESLVRIKPYFDTSGEMEKIMKVIINENKKSDKSSLLHACYAEVYEALGKPSSIDFEKAFNKITTDITKNTN